jgi:hypothetical protein
MTKLERAAARHATTCVTAENVEHDFAAGARWALEQMTSHAAIRAASESQAKDDECHYDSLGDLIGFSGENKTRTVVLAALAAVRKEIEG